MQRSETRITDDNIGGDKMAELTIRRAEPKDAEAIEDLEQICFSQPWSYNSIYYDIAENTKAVYLVAQIEEDVVGYAGLWKIGDEGHITNVAVAPEQRRKSIGDMLVGALIEVTEEEGIPSHTLEVRKSNIGAIRLYEKHGFKVEGERKAYYEDNGEDALIMWRKTEDER